MDVKTKPYSDPTRWAVVYPLYIDASKSLAQGRRISKAKAINHPTSQEIFDVLNHAGLRCELEQKKTHPRSQSRSCNPKQSQQEEGRVRVQLKKGEENENDGAQQQQKFMSREQMMLYAAEMIPKLKTRQQQSQGEHQQNETGKQKKRK